MIVRDLTGKERIAFVATEVCVCWICGCTIPQGQQYTRHALQTVRSVTFPICRTCFKFQPVDPITDRTQRITSQDTTLMPAITDPRTVAMPAIRQTDPLPEPVPIDLETPPLIPVVSAVRHVLRKVRLMRWF